MTMLDRMRRHKGWLKWSLALVVLAFVVFYIPDFLSDPTAAGTGTDADVIASIEEHEITAGEFRRRYQIQLQTYQGAYGDAMNPQLLRNLGLDRQILQQMIDEQAALAEAERQGITVSDEEVARQILTIPAFQENGRFIGEQRYEQVLRSQRPPVTKAQFEASVREGLMIDRLRAAVTEWLTLSDAEAEREYRQRNEKVRLQVVLVAAAPFRAGVTVTDADVQARYDARKEDYRVGERRKVKFLVLDLEQARSQTQVPEADIRRFYDDGIEQYSSPDEIRASHILFRTDGTNDAAVETRAAAVLEELRAGADFAALATKHSEDEGTKALGGDLDYFQRGRMVPEFENVAFNLQPGDISDLVKTPYGIHIIKLVDRKDANVRPLDEVRAEITEQLRFQLAQRAIAAQARAFDEEIVTPADLDRVAAEAGLAVTESGFFTRDEPVPGLGGAPQVAQEAFRMGDAEVSDALVSPRGPVFITVTGKEEPYVPPFDEVTDAVREDLIAERAADASRQRAGELAARLQGASDFGAAAKAAGFEARETELIAREAPIPDIGISEGVDAVAFDLPAGAVSDPIETAAGTAIVRVVERDDVTPAELLGALAAFRRELENERRGEFFSAYVARVRADQRISVREDVLQRVVDSQ